GLQFKGAVYPLHMLGTVVPIYIALLTLIVNIGVGFVLTVVFRALGVANGIDETARAEQRALT
ncbi:MAG TPA: hypothetical protein VIC29_08285, partial [Steroidobacteraceae bacterium]